MTSGEQNVVPVSSEVNTIATEIAALISAMTVDSITLSAAVDFCPDIDLNKVKARRIVVTPFSYNRDNSTRGYAERSAEIHVGICEKIALSDIDSRIRIVEGIMKNLERKQLPMSQAIVIRVATDPLYDADWLRANRVFVSVIALTVKVLAHD
jgi:hypothetical protein